MKLVAFLRRMMFRMSYYYQKVHFLILSIFVAGIVEYFFLYEFFMSIMAFAPLLAAEIIPVAILIMLAIVVWKGVKYIQKKMDKNKHRLLF
jgi:hypothetical protein